MSSAKRQVIQRLHDMGFNDVDIRAAIAECGYNTESCADWIVHRKQDKKPRLFVGMEVWIFSSEDNEWCPGNVVSITKQLISIIFNGHDFRWLEKDSDLYKIQEMKPNAVIITNNSNKKSQQQQQHQQIMEHNSNNSKHHKYQQQHANDQMMGDDDPYNPTGHDENEYAPPRADEIDYFVTFTESVLGLELYSDEDGFNCKERHKLTKLKAILITIKIMIP